MNERHVDGHCLSDTPEERFQKVHECVRKFTVLQYGVCTFSYNPVTRGWTCRPFNFWVFPDAKQGADGVFGCQASSLAFLAENGFDFNKCIRKGLPYVPASEKERVDAQRARSASRPPIVATSERDTEFVTRIKRQITLWLAAGNEDGEDDEDDEKVGKKGARGRRVNPPEGGSSRGGADAAHPNAPAPAELVLEPTNSFLRALTYQHLERDQFGAKQPPGFIASTSRDFPDGVARIVVGTPRVNPESTRRTHTHARALYTAAPP